MDSGGEDPLHLNSFQEKNIARRVILVRMEAFIQLPAPFLHFPQLKCACALVLRAVHMHMGCDGYGSGFKVGALAGTRGAVSTLEVPELLGRRR